MAASSTKQPMSRFRTAQACSENESVDTYAPITHCILTIDDSKKERIKRKFDMSYFMAKEGIAFEKVA